MAFSIVRPLIKALNWMAFCFGISLNAILVQLILRKTPKSMRIYSKILLQTCLTDMLLLTMTLLFQPYYFTTSKGAQEAILDGAVSLSSSLGTNGGRVWWTVLASVVWIFLVYVSMIGYVSQFIYRYLTLNWNKNISTTKYFVLLGFMLFFPLVYCVGLFVCYLPPVDHTFMDDKSVAELLGLNLVEDNILLAGYTFNDLRVSACFFYIITICTIAYIVTFVLAFLMHKLLRQRSKIGASSSLTKKMLAMNKQIARNLIIQASMPFLIYLSIVFLMIIILFQVNVSGWNWLQYYNLTLTIPMYLPSALNPAVSIGIIKYYRRPFVAGIKRIVSGMKKCLSAKAGDVQKQQQIVTNLQQPPNVQEHRWAISVIKLSDGIR